MTYNPDLKTIGKKHAAMDLFLSFIKAAPDALQKNCTEEQLVNIIIDGTNKLIDYLDKD